VLCGNGVCLLSPYPTALAYPHFGTADPESRSTLMPRVRKILPRPAHGSKHAFVVDANFLAMRFIPLAYVPKGHEQERAKACLAWWDRIDQLVKDGRAIVYVPDVCVAESFKVLAKKYFVARWLPRSQVLATQRRRLAAFVSIDRRRLKAARRSVHVHDIPTTREIIIGVDRFYELFAKRGHQVQIADLILASVAKYLLDFFALHRSCLHIVTLDRALRLGVQGVGELPNAYDPTIRLHRAELIFSGL
jgi:hypothetical protein